MKQKIKKVQRCLLCKNKKIKEIFSLGNLFVSNFVRKKDIKNGFKAPRRKYFKRLTSCAFTNTAT